MLVNVVTVYIKPERIDEFIDATLANHAGSRAEAGNRRFDVLQSSQDPARFLLYEVFDSPEAVEAHRLTLHYLAWKARVEPLMAKPREGVRHHIIAPSEKAAW